MSIGFCRPARSYPFSEQSCTSASSLIAIKSHFSVARIIYSGSAILRGLPAWATPLSKNEMEGCGNVTLGQFNSQEGGSSLGLYKVQLLNNHKICHSGCHSLAKAGQLSSTPNSKAKAARQTIKPLKEVHCMTKLVGPRCEDKG